MKEEESTGLREQVKWEKDMIRLGIAKYRAIERDTIERGEHYATRAGSKLLRSYMTQVSERISDIKAGNAGMKKRSDWVLSTIDADKIAYIGLRMMLECVYTDMTETALAASIGTTLEEELRFSKFAIENPAHFEEIERNLKSKRSTNHRHRRRVIVHEMNKQDIPWENWSKQLKIEAGMRVIGAILDSTDLFNRNTIKDKRKTRVSYTATSEVLDWVTRCNSSAELLMPEKLPCIVRPLDWENSTFGGYYTKRMRYTTPLITTRPGLAKDIREKKLEEADMPDVYNAVNSLQGTRWSVNKRVLEIVQGVWQNSLGTGMPRTEPYDFPKCPISKDQSPKDLVGTDKEAFDNWKVMMRDLHTLERTRQGEVYGVARTLSMAVKMEEYDFFHYVYQLDFRGRAYCATSGLSPQGSDIAKGMLLFAEAKPLGSSGEYWFLVHGANKYGNDKISYDDRIEWIKCNSHKWVAVADDPIGHRDVWGNADKPYQFLAWCFEYKEYVTSKGDFKSRLPVALDGSCNGIQHFSAMLRDEVGGAAVNLVPSDKPSDIYQDVADVCTDKLKQQATENTVEGIAAREWLEYFKDLGHDRMPRSLSKRPVMTLPYGSTQQSCTKYVMAWYLEQNKPTFGDTSFVRCVYLSNILWSSIGDVVIAARSAMKWLQDAVKITKDSPLIFYTPLGFPVVQAYENTIHRRINLYSLGNRVQVGYAEPTGEINNRKQRQGVSPNVVHSIDATHMMMVVNKAVNNGITDLAMIHDDFGCHAADIASFRGIIYDTFIELHTTDVLLDVFPDTEELPPKGNLDIDNIRNSLYFFG